ncbi:MAG: DUF2889 domain-containing protein [Burkholderiales bacterium]|nr:DUF2889 domain-containing protein [Burkholderiales bacterium]
MIPADDALPVPAVGRRPVHLRRIECAGYVRDDGLFDIEGRLVDTKPYDLVLPERPLPAHEPIHQMTLRLAVDASFLIHEAEARTLDAPYGVCGRIAPDYARLVGMRIEPGFNLTVKRMFRGTQGCSHITELLPALATTAFQVIWSDTSNYDNRAGDSGRLRSSPLGGCHALRLDGEVVLRHFRHLLPPGAG